MARKLVVTVVGDASSLERAFKKSSASANRFGKDMSKIGRGGFAATGAFTSLGRSVAFASGAFLGGFGLVSAIRASFEELTKQQQVAAQTAAVIKSTGAVAGVTAQHVDDYAASLLKVTGIDDEVIKSGENMLLTFTNIRNVTGKNNDIFDQATRVGLDMATALEGAGFEGGNLQTTMIRLGKALNDPVRGITALRRVGAQFTEAQTKLIKRLVESGKTLQAQKVILRELTREFGGSAAAAGGTLAGKLKLLREELKNMAAAALTQLLPAITKTVDSLIRWVQNTENQKRVMNDVKQVASAVGDVFNALRGIFNDLNNVTGSTTRTLKLLFAAFVAFKATELLTSIGVLSTNIASVGTSAKGATAEVAGLRGALAGVAAFAGLTIAVEVILHKKEITDKAGDLGVPFADKSGLDLLRIGAAHLGGEHSQSGLVRRFADDEKKRGRNLGDAIAKGIEEGRDAVVNALKKIRRHPGALPPGAAAGVSKADLQAIQQRLQAAREAVRKEAQDQAALAVDRASLTKPLNDDLAALEKQNALLKRRIAGGHDTIQILQEQIQVEQQIQQVQEQIAQHRVERLQFGVDVAAATAGLRDDLSALARLKAFLVKRLQADKGNLDLERQIFEVNQQIAAAQKQRRQQRQFRALGLGPTGEDLVPGVKNLKKQLGNIADAVTGSFLDTRKTRSLLRHIRQVLSGGLGSVSAEVRSKIAQILADLKAQLKQSSVDVTRFHKSATGQFVLAGAHPAGSGNVTIQGGIHLHGVQNVQQMENELAKRRKQRAHSRRATR